MEIDKEILKKTIKCENDFICLKNDNHVYCKTEEVVLKGVTFVKCLSENYCIYKSSHDHSYLCICPTRLKIFRKYGI